MLTYIGCVYCYCHPVLLVVLLDTVVLRAFCTGYKLRFMQFG